MPLKPLIRKYTPRPLWRAAVAGRNAVLDTVDAALGRRDEITPPRRLVFVGSGPFLQTGREFTEYFKQLAGLTPDQHVLDVGCGIGRIAIPLTKYLSASGSYDGFDIVPQGIEWCRTKITPRYPNFRFTLADIRNKEYNPRGATSAAEFRFPYDDRSFDFVFLTSVFTHMLPAESANYLAEIARVLKPGGRCLATWFLLNPESRALLAEGRAALDFRYAIEGCLTTNRQVPEDAIAYDEARVMEMYGRAALTLEPPVRYGSWCGRTTFLSFQDICISSR